MKRDSLSNDVYASIVNMERIHYYLAYDAKGNLPD